MSQEQYITIQKTRLIDLARLPADLLAKYLADKPEWEQKAIDRLIANTAA